MLMTSTEADDGADSAIRSILDDSVLLQAGAWLGGHFRRDSRATVRPPFDGLGFQVRLHDPDTVVAGARAALYGRHAFYYTHF